MGNINNYNHNKIDLILSNSDYWDFKLANSNSESMGLVTTGECIVSLFDFNNVGIYSTGTTSANTISSLTEWVDSVNTGYTFNTIGLTGIDNGLIPYIKNSGDTSNIDLLTKLTGSTLIIPSNINKLFLTKISGSTKQFIYPIDIIHNSNIGSYANFNGGFYQGYFKIDGSTYQVLPTRFNNGWVAEFWLNKNISGNTNYTGQTLNDLYPNNSGFFFYMGTRAENKFWNNFGGTNTGCTSGCISDSGCTDSVSEWCTTIKESNVIIPNSITPITLSPLQININEVTNPFLIYGRARSGCTSCGGFSGLGNRSIYNYDGTPIYTITPKSIITNSINPFLIYGRARSGCTSCGSVSGLGDETICSFSGFDKSFQFENKDYNTDIIDNSLGFRIRDDGSIGYRYLTVTGQCTGNTYISGVSIVDGYSASGLVQDNVWTNVVIRYSTEYYTDCELLSKDRRFGKLMFYIDGKLKFVVDDFMEFVPRRLNEFMEKQIGVPYNISIGGGTQGLIETQTFDGRDLEDLGLPIEHNFAGSFIGGIAKFKFNACDLYFNDISSIYNNEKNIYK